MSLGAKLASAIFGEHEYRYWFGTEESKGFLNELNDRPAETNADRAASGESAFCTFDELRAKGIRVVVLEKKINHSTNIALLHELQPDVVFSARFLHIFKEEAIKIPKYGVWNMHPGALPGYRGLHCDMRAMMNKEETVTMTFHQIDAGIDTGRILGVADVRIDPAESLFMHRIRLQVDGMNMFLREVQRLVQLEAAGETAAVGQAHVADNPAEEGRYFSWPEESEYEEFESMGLTQCNDADLSFVRSLFDRRCLPEGMQTIRQGADGMFFIAA